MKETRRISKIIKINEVRDFKVYCAFNNGEHRIIDFEKLFKKWAIKESDFNFPSTKETTFKEVELV